MKYALFFVSGLALGATLHHWTQGDMANLAINATCFLVFGAIGIWRTLDDRSYGKELKELDRKLTEIEKR